MAADQDILARIHELVDEEHRLRGGGRRHRVGAVTCGRFHAPEPTLTHR